MPSISTRYRRGLESLLDVAFPPVCAACGASIGSAGEFCDSCLGDLLLFDEPVCQRCSTPCVGMPAEATDCPACRDERWAFDRVLALGPYEGLLRRLVLDTKRSRGEPVAQVFGKMLARHHAAELRGVDLVVPVPQHWSRRLSRRADGVAALGRTLAGHAGTPFAKSLRRRRATPHQTSVAPSDRAANVRGAFSVASPGRLAGLTIALVDDVFTTGATCQAAARTLKKAGARRVVAVVVARRLGTW